MRILRLVGTCALGSGALVGLFIAFCIVPKVQQAEADYHTTLPAWIAIPTSLPLGDWVITLLIVITVIQILALVLALVPFVGESVRRVASGVLYAIAWLTAAGAIYFLAIGAAGMVFANGDLWEKNTIYARVLNQFALRESADGKFDELQAYISKMNSMKMVEVNDPSSLSREQRQQQITGILYGLKSSKDPVFLKQLLATSDEFRADFAGADFRSKPVLDAAALCGAPATDINAFYNWLEPKIGTDGWTKLPLHVLEFSH